MKANPVLNHSAAHLMAMAVMQLFPNTKLGIGPAIDEGFYFDFQFDQPFSEDSLIKIEKQMRKLASGNLPFVHEEITREAARRMFADQPFKLELIDEIPGGLTIYRTGKDFVDLCAGPHVPTSSSIKHFMVQRTAGAYWKGDAKNPALTRIYGTAWETKEELDAYLQLLEERKLRDHRKIGKDLDLFTFELMAGQGMPIWLPNGMVVKKQISRYLDDAEVKYGFQAVSTMPIGNVTLYKTSGHWDHYRKNMFPLMDVDGEMLVLRPMTCPHHCLIYKHTLRSYRELPFRLCENAFLFRYEASGALTGLERVRGMELTDGHVFCTPEQIEGEIQHLHAMVAEVHAALKIKIEYVSLSLRDPGDKEKYFQDEKMWQVAEESLRAACQKIGLRVEEKIGEAAFYGPKLDFQARSALGHEITISTLQLDMLLPKRFDVEYKDSDGTMKRPVLIHRGLIGTYERFVATLLEQTMGVLPLWLAPVHVVIIPVMHEKHGDSANRMAQRMRDVGLRARVDMRDDRVGRKIRDAQTGKVPYQIVIGDEEMGRDAFVSYRKYGSQDVAQASEVDFVRLLLDQIRSRA